MAQLSRLAQLFHKISKDLKEKDVRDLRSLLATDGILGKAQVENATPLEMFNMLVDLKTIGKGDLGFLVQVLRSLGKTKLADEARHLAEEQKNEESKLQHTDGTSDDSEEEFHSLGETEDNEPGDREPEDMEVKEPISVPEATGVSSATGKKQITGVTDAQQVISGLASLHIKDWQRMLEERTGEYPSAWPVSSPPLPEDEHDIKVRLETLLAELDTPAAMADRAQQADLHCQIGDLYRTRLNNIESALLYYQNMLECSQALSVTKQAQAHNRLGLTYDMLGKHEEAIRNHERLLVICKDVVGNAANICVAYKNLASSIALLGQVSDAKANYESALVSAEEAGNKTEQMDIYFRLGDLLMGQLGEVKVSEMYFKKMLTLAVDWGSTYFEMLAYNRLGLAHCEMGEYTAALGWHQKNLKASQECGDKKAQVTAHSNMSAIYMLLGKMDQATSHFDTALQLAHQRGDMHKEIQVNFLMGERHREQLHSPRTAIQYYEQYLALARQLEDRRQEGWAYNRLGLAHYGMGEYDKALEWHQKHLDISKDNEDNRQQIRAHTNLGCTYRLLGKLDQATSHHSTALEMTQQTENRHGQMDVYCKMGDMQRVQLHSPRTAIQYYDQNLALARQLGDRRQEGWAYNRLGDAYIDMREYEAALEWYQKHLKISQEIGAKKDEVTVLATVGNAYRLLGNTEQATSHFDTALQLAQQTENLHGQMHVYCRMGDMQREQLHSPRTSIQYYEHHLALARQLGDRSNEALAYNGLGLAHYAMGEYETALEWHKKGLDIQQETGDKSNLLITHENMAASYKALGKSDQARSHYETALTIAMETGNKQEQMDIYRDLGDFHREQLHEPQESHKYYTEMLVLAMELGDKDMERQAYNRLGLASEDMQDKEAALAWHQKNLKISQTDENKTEPLIANKNIARSYKALGKWDLARSHYQSALTIAMETGNKQEQREIYLGLGDLHRKQLHEPQVSHKYYTEMLALAKDLGRRDMERQAYNRLGLACEGMQDNEAALEWCQKALVMSKEDGDKIIAHDSIARSYQALGKLDQARSHYETALTIAMETGNKQEQLDIYLTLGELHWVQLHEPQESHKYYKEVLALAKDLGDKDKEILAYNRLGLACADMQDNEAALGWSQKFLAMSQEDEDKAAQIIAYRSIAASYKALGKLDQARSHYQTALTIAKETGNKQEQKDITDRLASL